MGAIVFGLGKRLWSSLVLVSFVWMTLFPTLVFADIEPILFERRTNGQTFAHFNLSIQRLNRSPSPMSVSDAFDDATSTFFESSPEFSIPLGKTATDTQKLISKHFANTLYENVIAVKEGFTWSSFGHDFFLLNSGDLEVSRKSTQDNSTIEPADSLHLYNPHGNIILKDELAFEHLILNTNAVTQEGNLAVKTLTLQIKEKYINKATLAVSKVLFDTEFMDPLSFSDQPQFINEKQIIGDDHLEVSGNGNFINKESGTFDAPEGLSLLNTSLTNHGVFNSHKTATFALMHSFVTDGPVNLEGNMHLSGTFALENKTKTGMLPSTHVTSGDATYFSVHGDLYCDSFGGKIVNSSAISAETMHGSLSELDNQGFFRVKRGFNGVAIAEVTNHATGRIVGDGVLTVGKGTNNGHINSKDLTLGIADSFSNTQLMDILSLKTQGDGVFHQQGTLKGSASINNQTFINETTASQTKLDLFIGGHVTLFENKKEARLKTKSLSFEPSENVYSKAVNKGIIDTGLFDNGHASFENQHVLTAAAWNQRGVLFHNVTGAALNVTDESTFDTDIFVNDGDIALHGNVSGQIQEGVNNGDLLLKANVALTGSTFLNTKNLRTHRDVAWDATIFENTDTFTSLGYVKMNGDELRNSGQFATQNGITFNGQFLKNTNNFSSRGPHYRVVNRIENTGKSAAGDTHGAKGIISETVVDFSGGTLHNEGDIKANQGVTYNGQTLTSTDTATLQTTKLTITTEDPLELKGVISQTTEMTLTAPTIENYVDLNMNQGKTTLHGDLINHNKLLMDTVIFEGRTISNAKDSVININLFKQSAAPLEHIDNKGMFIVQSGGAAITKLSNTGNIELLDGLYRVKELTNTKGEAIIDQLSPTALSLILDGKVDVAGFVPVEQIYSKITISGETIIRSGSFHAESLDNQKLTLGDGHYTIDTIKNTDKGSLILLDGAHVTTQDVNNAGAITSTVSLKLVYESDDKKTITPMPHPLDTVLNAHKLRQNSFNALSSEPLTDELLTKRSDLFDQTTTIHTLLSDKSKVNANRCATTHEKKTALQAIMGSALMTHVHNTPHQEELRLNTKLPNNLGANDPLFKHFEVLRLTETIARALAKQVIDVGYTALEDVLTHCANEYKTLCDYADLKKDQFLTWFRAVYDAHKVGLSKPKHVSIPEPQNSPRQTVIGPIARALSSLETLSTHHSARTKAFNAAPDSHEKHQQTHIYSVSEHTSSIAELLSDKSKVDTERYATVAEKKTILQAVMGAELTAHLQNVTHQQKLRLAPKLPRGLAPTDLLFKHFEILRLTEKLTGVLTAKTNSSGIDTLATALTRHTSDLQTLHDYSGLTTDQFLTWFTELYEAHQDGFKKRTESSLTIRVDPKKSGTSITKLGLIQTNGRLDLISKNTSGDGTPEWMKNLLKAHTTSLRVGGTLSIQTDIFDNSDILELPYYVHFYTKKFKNNFKLETNGLSVYTETFQNGSSNSYLDSIECHGPLIIESEGDIDNRFGVMRTKEKSKITSITGSILNGAPKGKKETITDTSHIWGHSSTYEIDVFGPNGAKITCSDDLAFYAPHETIDTSFGSIYAKRLVFTTLKKLMNKSGEIVGSLDMTFNVDELENTVGDIAQFQSHNDHGSHHWDHGRGNIGHWDIHASRFRQYAKSGSAVIQSLSGSIYFNVRSGKNVGSKLLSPKVIQYYADGIYTSDRPASFTHTEAPLNVYIGSVTYDLRKKVQDCFDHNWKGTSSLGDVKQLLNTFGINIEPSYPLPDIPAVFQAGDYIDIRTGDMTITGPANAPQMSIDVQGLISRAIGYKPQKSDPNVSVILDLNELHAEASRNSAVFRDLINQGGGVSVDALGIEPPLPSEPGNFYEPIHPRLFNKPSSTHPNIPPFLLSPEALRYTVQYALSNYLGHLNIDGKSGDPLIAQFFTNYLEASYELKDKNQPLTKEKILAFNKGMIYTVVKQIGNQLYRVHEMLTTPAMHNPHKNATLSGHDIEINMHGKSTFDRTVIAAYEPGGQKTTARKKEENETFLATTVDLSEPNEKNSARTAKAKTKSPNVKEPKKKSAVRIHGDDDITMLSPKMHSNVGVEVIGKKKIIIESQATRVATSDGFTHVADYAEINGGIGDVHMSAKDDILLRAIHLTSDTSVLIQTEGKVFDLPLALAYARTYTEYNKDGPVHVKEQGSNTKTSAYSAPESVTIIGNTIDSYAPTITAPVINFIAENGVKIHDVQNYFTRETQQHVKGKGWFGKDKDIRTQYYNERSRGGQFNGELNIKTTLGNVVVTNITASDVTIEAINGVVEFRQGVNIEQYSRTEQMKSLLWQSQQSYK